jgi:Fe2+ or Zn2+ uptake regulation protein
MIYNSDMQAVRETKYTQTILEALRTLKHASNAEIIEFIRNTYPTVSDTTIHRATTRLAKRNEIGIGPRDAHGNLRYDTNTNPHDHFICTGCGGIRDLDVAEKVLPTISNALGGCGIEGRLELKGLCTLCNERTKQ